MDVSWSDLNKVREAGDYPFRSGMITITFAEIAIWQKNPHAKFQLMRKHPIRNQYSYVLGRQVDEKSVPAEPKLIYQSSNGDLWYLSQNPETGAAAVKHLPNPQSGGQVSYTEIDTFLFEGANGPEHQALRGLIGTNDSLHTMLIAYDVHPQKGEAYNELGKVIQSLGCGGTTSKQFGLCDAITHLARSGINSVLISEMMTNYLSSIYPAFQRNGTGSTMPEPHGSARSLTVLQSVTENVTASADLPLVTKQFLFDAP
jgi:hypothetical protein